MRPSERLTIACALTLLYFLFSAPLEYVLHTWQQVTSGAHPKMSSSIDTAAREEMQSKMPGLTTNYAAQLLGATVVSVEPAVCNGGGALISDNADKYMICPCAALRKQFIVQLIRDVEVRLVMVQNVERFSGGVRGFTLLGSRRYPTDRWEVLGRFEAAHRRGRQYFEVAPHSTVRYVKFQWTSSHGSEPWCTMTGFQVYGIDVLETLARYEEEVEEWPSVFDRPSTMNGSGNSSSGSSRRVRPGPPSDPQDRPVGQRRGDSWTTGFMHSHLDEANASAVSFEHLLRQLLGETLPDAGSAASPFSSLGYLNTYTYDATALRIAAPLHLPRPLPHHDSPGEIKGGSLLRDGICLDTLQLLFDSDKTNAPRQCAADDMPPTCSYRNGAQCTTSLALSREVKGYPSLLSTEDSRSGDAFGQDGWSPGSAKDREPRSPYQNAAASLLSQLLRQQRVLQSEIRAMVQRESHVETELKYLYSILELMHHRYAASVAANEESRGRLRSLQNELRLLQERVLFHERHRAEAETSLSTSEEQSWWSLLLTAVFALSALLAIFFCHTPAVASPLRVPPLGRSWPRFEGGSESSLLPNRGRRRATTPTPPLRPHR